MPYFDPGRAGTIVVVVGDWGSPFHDSMTHDLMTLTKLKDDSRFMTPVIMSPLRRHIRLLHGKIGFFGGEVFGPSSVKRGRTYIVLG